MKDVFLFVLEMIGTVAFAISGAMVGVQKKMDLFGIAILGMVTATGGGAVRDLLLNIAPPTVFRNPVYALTAIGVSIIVFIPAVRRAFTQHTRAYELTLRVIDAVGLGVFTVVGVQAAYAAFPDANLFLTSFIGALTAVGGGILRDVLAGTMPYVFVKHFYACAVLIGAIACALLWPVGSILAMLAGMGITILLRLLAAHFHWNLPKAK